MYNKEPLALSWELLAEIGQAWGGRHWQSDMARETGLSKSLLTRYKMNQRFPDETFRNNLDRALVDKIEDVAKFLGHPGSPKVDNSAILSARQKIEEGIAELRKEFPAIKRVTIEETSIRKHPPGRKRKKVVYSIRNIKKKKKES